MKKLLIIPAMLATMATASDYDFEITPLIGYNFVEGNLNLKDHIVMGQEFQYNGFESAIKPELMIFYAPSVDSEGVNPETSANIFKVALNGVHEYSNISSFTPFVKAGLGYENMSRKIVDSDNGMFVDAGAGFKVPLTDSLAFKLETLYTLKYNEDTAGAAFGDSNLMLLAGISISLGKKAQQTIPVAATPVVLVDGDDDKDGVSNSIDKCPTTQAGKNVNSDGCFVDGDDDKDGVLNSSDKCPATQAGKKVNAEGCFIDGDDDKDGVLNSSDKCPTTQAGKKVNAEGCFIDSDDDKDGIFNTDDICPNTPMGSAVNSDGCPQTAKLNVAFGNNSSDIQSSSYAEIDAYAKFLSTYRNYNAKIIGYTDDRGQASYNQRLSESRAKSVVDMLINKGVNSSQLTYLGEGENNPIATNNTKQGRAQNRRIEAELSKK